jgi:hypothetical protein
MDNYSTYRALTPLQFATVMDSAKQRATQARREAMNDFWDAVAQQMRSAWRAGARYAASGQEGSDQAGHSLIRILFRPDKNRSG